MLALQFSLVTLLFAGCTIPQTAAPTQPFVTSVSPLASSTSGNIAPSPTIEISQTPTAIIPQPSITYTARTHPTYTPTPKPSPTLTPTSTPYPPLSETGPYLAYFVNLPEGNGLTLLNSDGSGRKVLPLPEGAHIGDITDSISPDGEWLAFHTGSVETEPYDLRLNLMHLSDGEIYTVTQLLSADYPNNFQGIAENIFQANPDRYKYLSVAELAQEIRYNFQGGIYEVNWAPNSRYLAFAGQMNGPSSDIYRYDIQLGTIVQLTDGPEQICGINWSPDGKWILHEASNEPGGEGWAPNLYAVQADGSKAKKLFESIYLWGWLSSTTYAVYDAANGPGAHNLRFIDIETDQPVFQWADTFGAFAIDTQSSVIVIDSYSYWNSNLKPGTFLIYPSGSQIFVTGDHWSWGLTFRGGEINRFVGSDYGRGIFGISKNGNITKITDKFGRVNISPNYQWMLTHYYEQPGIDLFSETDEFVRRITDDNPDGIVWRLTSDAIFYQVGYNLYYVAIPNGQPILIDNNVVPSGWDSDYGFVWIK